MGSISHSGTHRKQLCDLACEQLLGEVIWNNGWDFGDNIFILKDLLHRCLVQIKSALGVPLSIQACWKRVTPEDMVVHSQDVMYFNGKSWENLNSIKFNGKSREIMNSQDVI